MIKKLKQQTSSTYKLKDSQGHSWTNTQLSQTRNLEEWQHLRSIHFNFIKVKYTTPFTASHHHIHSKHFPVETYNFSHSVRTTCTHIPKFFRLRTQHQNSPTFSTCQVVDIREQPPYHYSFLPLQESSEGDDIYPAPPQITLNILYSLFSSCRRRLI